MTMSAALMQQMSDEHLCNSIRIEMDPLTTTDVERELLSRLEGYLAIADVVEMCEGVEISGPELRRLLDACDNDIAQGAAILEAIGNLPSVDISEVCELIALGAKFKSIAEEAGDVFERLNELAAQ